MSKLLFTTMALSLIAFAGGCHDTGARPAPSATPEKPATSPVATTKPVPPAKPLKLAFVTNNPSEFWKLAISGVRRSESETKTSVTVRMPPSGRVAEQNQILENLVEEGYDAIAVSVISAQEQTELLNKLSARTRLITFDADAPDSNRLVYIGTDNEMAGKTLGNEIVKLLPGGGQMGVFVGSISAPNASQRLAGIRQAIKGKNIDIVVQLEDRTDRAKARANVEDVLSRHPDVKLLCGIWSYNGPAIAAALEGSGKNEKCWLWRLMKKKRRCERLRVAPSASVSCRGRRSWGTRLANGWSGLRPALTVAALNCPRADSSMSGSMWLRGTMSPNAANG